MLALLAALLALQGAADRVGRSAAQDTARRDVAQDARRDSLRAARRGWLDSVRAARDSAAEVRGGERAAERRARSGGATASERASAFRDDRARDLLDRARVARFEQDSTLQSYDAVARQRISAGLNFKAVGRDRLLFRVENAARVRWSRGNGVWVDVLGTRTAAPISFPGARVLTGVTEMTPIPYFPGREGLMWFHNFGDDGGDGDGDDDIVFVHPLADGAEASYKYAVGDSMRFRLPDGRMIRLVEMTVRARESRWNLILGSLWFDASSAQLVRAAFRPAAPFNIIEFLKRDDRDDVEEIPKVVRATIMNPAILEFEWFTVEYALHGGRWWLPRVQTASARMRLGFLRAPATIEETFRYASVNGADSVPPVPRSRREYGYGRNSDFGADLGDVIESAVEGVVPGSPRARNRYRPEGSRCSPGDTLMRTQRRVGGAGGPVRVAIRVPCDTAALAHSPELPPSIFDKGEEMFARRDADQLVKELNFSLQPVAQGRAAPSIHYGLDRGLLRYNRVEGLSAGVEAEQVLGRGYAGAARARVGTADWHPNAELRLTRNDARRTVALGAYHRLAAANDWGDPFGFGPSLSALLFARDEGFYYRATGAELTGSADRGGRLTWRLFGEAQRAAELETQLSLAKVVNGVRFIDNIRAAKAALAGGEVRLRGTRGLDPRGLRMFADARAEAVAGTFDYARGALDATLSHGLGSRLDGALTLGGGATAGRVPPQRLWYLGGSQTVRGQGAGTAAGDAYWLARAELGTSALAARPVIFYDVGWAGARAGWRHPGTPMSGAGVGASLMDGLIRFDVARGIRPERGWRADIYVEGRF